MRNAGHIASLKTHEVAVLESSAVPAKFLVVDDHPLFREAIQLAVLVAYPEAKIVEATSIAGARAVIAKEGPFDLVLLDLTMPGTRGFEGLLELRTHHPKLPIVIVSALDDPQIIHQGMTYGAAGFIPKSVRKGELADAIQTVMNGCVYLPKDYAPPQARTERDGHASFTTRLGTLTPQQLRVLMMLRQGKLNKQIAFELDVGETTVKAHVSEILRKLNVASRTQAVIEAQKIDFDATSAVLRDTDKPGGTR
ncbi:MAG: response regulator transcription factor [Hyphomicrobium sp.]